MAATRRSLADLLAATPVLELHGDTAGLPVASVTQDSRTADADACFVAVPGFRVDGHRFLAEARRAGARAIVVQADRRALWAPLLDQPGAVVAVVADTRAALADLAAAFHGYPARALTVVGVTGTDGKSTTCYLTSAILEAAGHRTGLIGGVQFKVGDEWRMNDLTQTSPESPLVQELLAEMVEAGVTHAVIESTSHGLALHRLDHCEFDVAVFTGLSDDHLDFHQTREAYRDAKAALFRALDAPPDSPGAIKQSTPKRAVVNADDAEAAFFAAATSAPVVRVGLPASDAGAADLDVTATGLHESPHGSTFTLRTPVGEAPVALALPARFNVRNALAAAGAAHALGIGPAQIAAGLAAVRSVPGRMEPIDCGQPYSVVVDAAATTDALRVVLASVRPLVQGRLILVFGCAGERDPARRSGMGAVAAQFADYSVLTSENPRSEEPAAIVREIAAAMEAAGRRAGREFEEEPDRRAAIARGLALARPGDYVLIAGKGTEQTLIFADAVQPWDDREVVRALFAART